MSYSTHDNLKQLHEDIDELTAKIINFIFSGSGPNDMIPFITPERNIIVAASAVNYHVEIISVGMTVNKINWTDLGSGGQGWRGTSVIITGGDQALNNGISIKFNESYGHTLNDWWRFTLNPPDSDDERDLAYDWVNDRLRSFVSIPVSDPSETLILAEANFAISLILRAKKQLMVEDFRDEASRLMDELLESPEKVVETEVKAEEEEVTEEGTGGG